MIAPLDPDASFAELLQAWQSSADDFVDLATSLTQDEWDTPTDLPGWTVGDVIAHVGWIEGVLLGEVDPPHEPDWDDLPHVRNDFGRITEVPVDLRRGWSRDAVLVELVDVMTRRSAALANGPQDATVETVGPLGIAPLGRVIRMRTMDTWVHEQDIRDALSRPGHRDSPGARATAAQLLPGLPKVWGKGASAHPGDVLRVTVSGPELVADVLVVVDDGGRARLVAEDLLDQVGPATTTLTMPWSTYLALACGRGDAVQHRRDVSIEGDRELADKTLAAFTVMI